MPKGSVVKSVAPLLAIGLIAGFARPSLAATLTQSQTFSINDTLSFSNAEITADKQPWSVQQYLGYTSQFSKLSATSTSLTFNGFDSALGTLQGVQIEFWGDRTIESYVSRAVSGTAIVMIDARAPTTNRVSVNGVGISSTDELGLFRQSHAGRPSCDLFAPDFCISRRSEQFEFAGSFAGPLASFLSDEVSIDLSTDLLMSGQAYAAERGNSQWFFGALSNFDWVGGVNVSYSYEPARSETTVPEPGSWALMTLGFGVAGAAFRRRPFVNVADRTPRTAPRN